MKKLLYILVLLLMTAPAFSQIKDTLIEIEGQGVVYDLNLSQSQQEQKQALKQFVVDYRKALKASQSVKTLFSQIPLSNDPCTNNTFNSGYAGWTGLSLRHSTQLLPIENGLALNPGILPLPFTNTASGGKYTALQSTGPDPLIASIQTTSNITPSTASIRLGNNKPGKAAEGIAKRFVVTSANAKYYFQYAVVMDPSHSGPDGVPNGSEVFFIAEAIDQLGNTVDKVVEIGNPSNPFISQVSTTDGNKYYRDWRCVYLDLSSHIGQEVMVMFINSDCSAGAHEGYTYVDETCTTCKNINEGDISLTLSPDNCISFPQQINGTFSLPTSNNVLSSSITLYLYQNGILLNTIGGPTISGNNYSFTLNSSDIPANQIPCYDIVAKLSFQIQDIMGNVSTIERWSSDVSGSTIEGEMTGLNNDLCFCVDCCETPLKFKKSGVTTIQNATINGVDLSTATQTFLINSNSQIPIVEMRVAVTDIVFDYNYESCGQCVDNPALWGSTTSNSTQIGAGLQQESLPYHSGNIVAGHGNLREVIWSNANGVMLQQGNTFDITYWLPPLSEIPCCATKVTICQEISWKDANCQVCTEQVCTEILLAQRKN